MGHIKKEIIILRNVRILRFISNYRVNNIDNAWLRTGFRGMFGPEKDEVTGR
jgi:hypothetical protein